MMRVSLLAAVLALTAVSCAGTEEKKSDPARLPSGVEEKDPVNVVMETSMGTIKLELYPGKAPITVRNFLGYVDDKFYDNTLFHRVIGKENSNRDFMIQGGGYLPGMKEKKAKGTIKNEAGNGLSNVRGTIAMAREDAPDTAASEFFINVGDNKYLDRSPDGDGYCVFGKVTEGMDVVDKIKAVKTAKRFGSSDVPVQDVIIKSVRRADK